MDRENPENYQDHYNYPLHYPDESSGYDYVPDAGRIEQREREAREWRRRREFWTDIQDDGRDV
jgi:hypothetical protein